MTRRTSEDSDFFAPTFWRNLGLASLMAPDANLTMLDPSPPVVIITPTAARTVLLPPEKAHQLYIIWNMAGGLFDVTVKEDSNVTTIATISQNEAAIFYVDAALAWHRMIVNAAAT